MQHVGKIAVSFSTLAAPQPRESGGADVATGLRRHKDGDENQPGQSKSKGCLKRKGSRNWATVSFLASLCSRHMLALL